MTRLPRFIVCANPACQAVKEVRRPSDQRRRKYCSHRCASHMTAGSRRAACSEACRRVALAYAHRRRLAALERLKGLTPLESYRRGYDCGFESAKRQFLRKYTLIPKGAAA